MMFSYRNKKLFSYMYDENINGYDIEGFIAVTKIDSNFNDFMLESKEGEDMLSSQMKDQLDNLERVKRQVEEREKAKQIIIKAAMEFRDNAMTIAELPDDYEEVSNRISEEVVNERKAYILNKKTESTGGSAAMILGDEPDQPDIMKSVQNKLLSTFYGFSNENNTEQTLKRAVDTVYAEGIQRIKELDKVLAIKEREEKAVKAQIREDRKKDKEEELGAKTGNLNKLTSSEVDDNKSGLSNNSSKSDFFLTQNKKLKESRKLKSQTEPFSDTITKPGSSRPIKRNITKQDPLMVVQPDESQELYTPLVKTPSMDHIKKNIQALSLSEHEGFLASMEGKTLVRYRELVEEIESGLESDDPEEFKRVSALHYEMAYGYPAELREKFNEIDDRIVEMMGTESKNNNRPSKDVIRDRVEQKELKRKLKALDLRIDQLRVDVTLIPAEMLDEKIGQEIALLGEENLKVIKEGIDLSGFDDLAEIDEEAHKLLQGIDVEAIENYLQTCLTSIEATEYKLKQEETALKDIEPNVFEEENKFTENYLEFLGKNKTILDEFKVSDKINSEEEWETYEQSVMEKLRENGDRIDGWYRALEEGKEELDIMYLNNRILIEDLKAVEMRDPDRFDDILTEEMRIKYPEIFKNDPLDSEETQGCHAFIQNTEYPLEST